MRPVLLLLLAFALRAAAEPSTADPEREAVRAYRAHEYPAFLSQMREVARREPDVPRVLYNLAAGEALAGQPEAAVKTLRRLVEMGLGFEVDKDADFASLKPRDDYREVLAGLARNRAPRGHAELALTLKERDLLTEGVAYDPVTRRFFVSSARRRKIVAVTPRGEQRDFILETQDGIGCVLGIRVDAKRRVLWASSSAFPHMLGYAPEDKDTTGLFAFDLGSGNLVRKAMVPRDGKPHGLGDVVVSSSGEAFTTDSLSPAIYHLRPGGDALELLAGGDFRSLQGLALSQDERTLYFADYARGIYALDLATRAVKRLEVSPQVAAVGVDGLYVHGSSLVVTQNGVQPQRVAELGLDAARARIVSQRILLSADPRADDFSLGAIVGDTLYLNAKSGWAAFDDAGKPKRPMEPHTLLKVPLSGR